MRTVMFLSAMLYLAGASVVLAQDTERWVFETKFGSIFVEPADLKTKYAGTEGVLHRVHDGKAQGQNFFDLGALGVHPLTVQGEAVTFANDTAPIPQLNGRMYHVVESKKVSVPVPSVAAEKPLIVDSQSNVIGSDRRPDFNNRGYGVHSAKPSLRFQGIGIRYSNGYI